MNTIEKVIRESNTELYCENFGKKIGYLYYVKDGIPQPWEGLIKLTKYKIMYIYEFIIKNFE